MNPSPLRRPTVLLACLAAITPLCMAQSAPPPAARPAGLKTDAIGRLFTTPEQRERIDNPGTGPASPVVSGDGRIDGVVRRSDGRTVVWIDGTARLENQQALPTLSVQPAKAQK